ncbi:AAC(3) family N-acetyltransferase [Paenibacillus herberti]|uniref:Aminoglycoside N(3)-acetyltransferase n=1 Tax=Paenibacillus herberti TaxID=1619309 RepID=A0A229NVY4_9BACL|nr:AAC(3) family N-acetyltransferase [Paenibacillus herberti]
MGRELLAVSIYDQEWPLTRADIVKGLQDVGVREGMTLLVHSSMKSFNRWIPGKSQAVIEALEEAIGPQGTLVMPAQTGELSEPSHWCRPPVPEAWWPIIRAEMPPYRTDLTATRGMGVIAESFRCQDGTLRSNHPQTSFTARGPLAETILREHALDFGLGDQSPLARIYEHGGYVLLLGVDHRSNTSLHLAENRASWPGKHLVRQGAPMLVDGVRQWVEFEEFEYDDSDFNEIGEAFEQMYPDVRSGRIGDCLAKLLPQRELVDFSIERMTARSSETEPQ